MILCDFVCVFSYTMTCYFDKEWADREIDGIPNNKWQWLSECDADNTSAYCKACIVSFAVRRGYQLVQQHASGIGHEESVSGLRGRQSSFTAT